jgi:hypothetical protein
MQIAGFEDVVRDTGSLAVPHYHPRQSCACLVGLAARLAWEWARSRRYGHGLALLEGNCAVH